MTSVYMTRFVNCRDINPLRRSWFLTQ